MESKTDWKLDDIVMPEDMNRIEGGITEVNNGLSGETTARQNADTAFNVALKEVTVYSIYVSPTGSDLIGDGSASKPYATLQKAFTRIPAFIKDHYRINLKNGTYDYGNLGRNYMGTGVIDIDGESMQSTILSGTMYINGKIHLSLKNLTFKHAMLSDAQINLQYTTSFIQNCCFDGVDKSKPYNFMLAYDSYAILKGCTFKNATIGVVCGGVGAEFNFIENCSFENCNIGLGNWGGTVRYYTKPIFKNCDTTEQISSGGVLIKPSGGIVGS